MFRILQIVFIFGACYALEMTVAAAAEERPLGVLWLPDNNLSTQTVSNVEDTLYMSAAPAVIPAPAPSSLTPGNTVDKPLGTLWYQAGTMSPTAVPDDNGNLLVPAGMQSISNAPANATVQPVIIPVNNSSEIRPLGSLWNPGKYNVEPYQEPVFVSQPTGFLSNADLAKPIVKSNGTPDRPLGLLINQSKLNSYLVPSYIPQNNVPQDTGLRTPVGVPQSTELSSAISTALDENVSFTADQMQADQNNEIVTASGNVQVAYQNRRLIADSISYNQKTDVVTAKGTVTLIEPNGETVFGDYMEVSGDLKDAVITNIGMILADQSRIAGLSAKHTQGTRTTLNKAVYSPCKPCEEDPSAAPLWQLKAVKVVHNKEAHTISYEDVWFELYGVPVAYFPYFQHPDPTIKRKSGFLMPTIGNSSDLGVTYRQPYFWNISPHEDATITPIYSSSTGPSLAVEYRKELIAGTINASASIATNDDGSAYRSAEGTGGVRGHILSNGRFNINDTWRWGFDLNRDTDDTYMRRYGYGYQPTLQSDLFAEGFRGRNYFTARTDFYQTHRSDVSQDTVPVVLPLIDFNHMGSPDRLGGRTQLDVNFLSLLREDGTDVRRLSIRPSWERTLKGDLGDLYNIHFGLKSDVYHSTDVLRDDGTRYTGVAGRFVPQMALSWRMPFIKHSPKVNQIIEPMASFVLSPYGGNSDKIPNEDSLEMEFDDSNLFSLNRFSGIDRVEGGPRINYGIKWGVFGDGGQGINQGHTTLFVGQSYRFKEDGTFAEGSGLENKRSDYVASLQISPGEHFNLTYKTRMSKKSFNTNRDEIALNAGIPAFKINVNYISIDAITGSEFSGREELNLNISSKINRFWNTGFNSVRDMDTNEFRSFSLNAKYEDECVAFTTTVGRTLYNDRDLKPADSVMFYLVFKTLGEIKTGISG